MGGNLALSRSDDRGIGTLVAKASDVRTNSFLSGSRAVSDQLVETGMSCPFTGRGFLTRPEWSFDNGRFGMRMEVLPDHVVVDRAWGEYRQEDTLRCFEILDDVLARLPASVVVVEDLSRLAGAENAARRLYESELRRRADRIQGVVFLGVGPMFRLFLRLGRRRNAIPFPMQAVDTWEQAIEAATSILEGSSPIFKVAGGRGIRGWRRIPIPAFLLRGYAEELRDLVSDMPWDTSAEAANPLKPDHPFHDVVEAWVAVKRDMDLLDKLRQERERDLRETAKILAESEGRYRAVFEASGTALILYGADRKIRMVNRATERMARLSRAELEGNFEWIHFAHPDDAPLLLARHNARQLDPSADLGRVESRFIDSEGRTHWADVTVESIPGTDLRVASLDDRTDFRAAHQALEESERRFRQIVETSQEGIWTADLAGRTTWANGRMAELLGCDSDRLESCSFMELLPAEPNQRLDVLQSLLEGHSVVFEGRLPREDGKLAWAIVSASPIRNSGGAPAGFFAMCTDITRRHQAEDALRDLNRGLEDRVRERTAELESANAELARALRAREDFLASMSHELRTPLAAVLGALETLRDVRDEDRKGYLLDLAERNGRQLLSLIEDVLDFARGRAGRLSVDPRPLDPVEAVHEAEQSMELQAFRNGVRLSVAIGEPLPFVMADPVRLRQILTNFANNALRHAGEGGEVELAASRDPDGVRFEVRDRGAGIPEHERPRLFQAFEQLSPSGRRGGTGLGLALSRQLAQAMGGEVGYRPREGGGSVFWLRLPQGARDLPESVDPPPAATERGLPSGRILVVEDERDLREILSEHLGACGWEVVSAPDADSALSVFEQADPEVAVVDLGLPGMDGLELIGRLRNLSRSGALGVLALTGQAFPEDADRCRQAGADRFLTKPTSLRRTESVLRELLAQVREDSKTR